MKQRFSYLDLKLITNEVQRELTNCYLQNVYSLENSSRHFLFKFDAGVHQTGKRFLMVDPGMRYHFTNYQHEPTQQPSHFVQKLRKYLKNRRATNFWVAPSSRLMVITFTEGQYYLVFEFFAGGNVILLDKEFKILTLFRVVRDVGPSHQTQQIGEHYALDMDQSLTEQTFQSPPAIDDIREWVAKDKLGKVLYTKISDPSSSLIEYCLRINGLDPKQKLSEPTEEELNRVLEAIKLSLGRAHGLMTQTTSTPGYILFDNDGNSLEFEPFAEYFQLVHPDLNVEEHSSYNATVDKYFGAILSDKGVNKVEQLHALAESRLNAARNERQKRVDSLVSQLTKNEQMGNALQENAQLVESAINAVKALVDQGVDWGDAQKLINMEKEKGNVVAQAVHSLQLQHLQVTLSLDGLKVPVHIEKSAFANARDYFEVRKTALTKIEKTEQHANKALKSAEVKIKRDLELNLAKHKQAGQAAQLHAIRQPHWFEKFWWFLTSTNHLVIAARDEMQRDLLLRRYFHDGDLALTSDAPEASLLIIKNPTLGDVPPQTLIQATAYCVATSVKSWEGNSKAPAWFLTRKQVPRVNEDGDPISIKDFRHITPRTLVPPSPLDMGMALLWQCEAAEDQADDESKEGKGNNGKATDADDSDDDEFPDTNLDSEEEFPDTNLDSDDNFGSSDSEDETSAAAPSDSDADTSARETVSPAPETANSSVVGSSASSINNGVTGAEAKEEEEEDEGGLENALVSEAPSSAQDTPDINSLNISEEDQFTQPSAGLPRKVRGNKKKLKKYQDQDEEDRLAAMERLGTLKGLQRKAEEQELKEKGRREQQELLKSRKERRRKAELAYIQENEAPIEKQPHPTDLLYRYKDDEPIIAAVPMFAPWPSIQKAQYKVKLVNGSLKKGKASSELLRILPSTGDQPASEREQKLVAGIRQVDVQQSIAVSRVQIATVTSAKGSKTQGGKNVKAGSKGGKTSGGKKKKH